MGLIVVVALWLGASCPAEACTPVPILAAGGVMVGWLCWLMLFPLLALEFQRRASVLPWVWAVPLGFIGFAVPMFMMFALPGAVLFLAFPMHLAVEFLQALFRHIEYPAERGRRLTLYGIPLVLMVAVAVATKYAAYAANGGWRTFWWNYSTGVTGVFFILATVIGLAVLFRSQRYHGSVDQT